jgi:hypothetical protein
LEASNPKQENEMKNTATKNTSVKPAGANSNHKDTVASGLRVRTALTAGLNFAKIKYEYQ